MGGHGGFKKMVLILIKILCYFNCKIVFYFYFFCFKCY
jgi:hypothetical protein